MKKIIILFAASLYFFGCEKIPDNVIDTTVNEFQVTKLSVPENFTFNTNDSSFITTIEIKNKDFISMVWMNVYSPNGKEFNDGRIDLLDNGDNKNGDNVSGDGIFSAKSLMSRANVNGEYDFEFYVVDKESNQHKVATHTMNYYNNQENYPPVISNLIMPDTVRAGQKFTFTFTIKAFDPNSLDDIQDVYFKFIRLEDNSESDINYMHDDGNMDVSGDSQAGDGTYSFKNYFTVSTQGKSRLFIFQAKDRSGALSNIITHKIVVK